MNNILQTIAHIIMFFFFLQLPIIIFVFLYDHSIQHAISFKNNYLYVTYMIS